LETREDIEREQHEAYRRSEQGVIGNLKDLIGGSASWPVIIADIDCRG